MMTNIHLAERDPQHHVAPMRGVAGHVPRLRILLSYHYYRDTDLDALFRKHFTEPYPEVFADSGAFSAKTQGIAIDLTTYAQWVKRWRHHFAVYSNLDAIGSAEQTRVNQQRLEDLGLAPLPVFHTGEPWKYLDWYIERYPYMALGGMVPYTRTPKKLMPWVIQCFKRAEGRTVYHGFGCTSWPIIKNLPWYSVDSSSWGSGFRFGQVPLFNDARGGFDNFNLGNRKSVYKHAATIRELGFNPEDFADRKRNDRAKICAISALSYIRAEAWLRKRHGIIRIPHRGDEGLKVFCADKTGYDDAAAAEGLRVYLADARGACASDIAAADAGVKIHLVAGDTGNMSIKSLITSLREHGETE